MLKRLGLTSTRVTILLDQLASKLLERGITIEHCKRSRLRTLQRIHFINYLDQVARSQNCSIWAEKTPAHLHYIRYIESTVANAFFVHVIRDPHDVVASLYAAAREYPEVWGNRSILDCCGRWNQDVAITLRHINNNNHIAISYEALNEDPNVQIGLLLNHLGARSSEIDMDSMARNANDVVSKNEPWKSKNSLGLVQYKSDKYTTLLNESQRAIVARSIDRNLQADVRDKCLSP